MSGALLVALLVAAPPALDPPGVVRPEAEAAWRAAVALREQGATQEAAAAFEALADRYPQSRRAPQALAAAGTLARWALSDEARAERLWMRALAGEDDAPGVDAALDERLALERDRRGVEGELRLLHAITRARPKAVYTPRLLLRAAVLLLDEVHRVDDALAAARAAVAAAEGTTWWDDAAMTLGRACRAAGRADEALAQFRRVIASHRDTLLGGDENSDLLDDAYLAAAETLAADPARASHAERAYLRLVDEVPHSPWVDDALVRAEALARARGDGAAAERYRARLVALRPGSRFVRPSPSAVAPSPRAD